MLGCFNWAATRTSFSKRPALPRRGERPFSNHLQGNGPRGSDLNRPVHHALTAASDLFQNLKSADRGRGKAWRSNDGINRRVAGSKGGFPAMPPASYLGALDAGAHVLPVGEELRQFLGQMGIPSGELIGVRRLAPFDTLEKLLKDIVQGTIPVDDQEELILPSSG